MYCYQCVVGLSKVHQRNLRGALLVFPFSTFFWLLILMVEDSELTVLFSPWRYLSASCICRWTYDNDWVRQRHRQQVSKWPHKDKKAWRDIRSPPVLFATRESTIYCPATTKAQSDVGGNNKSRRQPFVRTCAWEQLVALCIAYGRLW